MRKLFNVFLAIVLLGGIALPASSIAATNLVDNSSFEILENGGFADWTEGGNSYVEEVIVRTGDYAAGIYNDISGAEYGDISGSVKSDWFDFTECGTYEYGAYFKIYSVVDPTTIGWPADRPGITTEVKTASGTFWPNDIVNVDSLLNATWFEYDGGWLTTEWLLLGGTFNVTECGTGYVNIFLQDYFVENYTAVVVDDVFVRMAPVPEPSTMLLFGFGLGALGIYSRKRSKK